MLEDAICKCKGATCTQRELYNRLLYAAKECHYYPPVEAMIGVLDIAFLACFTVELACKVAARGFILHRHAYLREATNWLDFVVVVTGILSQVADTIKNESLQQIGFFDVLRLVRVFRPLRSSTLYCILEFHLRRASIRVDGCLGVAGP